MFLRHLKDISNSSLNPYIYLYGTVPCLDRAAKALVWHGMHCKIMNNQTVLYLKVRYFKVLYLGNQFYS